MENMLYGVGLVLTDESIMAPYAAKKFPTAGVFSRLSPWGCGGFFPRCPPGGGCYQTQSHHSGLLPHQRRLIEGSVKKCKKNLSQRRLHFSTHTDALNSCKKWLLGVGRCRNWWGGGGGSNNTTAKLLISTAGAITCHPIYWQASLYCRCSSGAWELVSRHPIVTSPLMGHLHTLGCTQCNITDCNIVTSLHS